MVSSNFIERLWQSVKHEEVYLKAYQDGKMPGQVLVTTFCFYNTERPHQALSFLTSAEIFTSTSVEAVSEGMIESLTSVPLRIA